MGAFGRCKGCVREMTTQFVILRLCNQQIDAENAFVVVHDDTMPKFSELEGFVFTLIQRGFFQFLEKLEISCSDLQYGSVLQVPVQLICTGVYFMCFLLKHTQVRM